MPADRRPPPPDFWSRPRVFSAGEHLTSIPDDLLFLFPTLDEP
jgi:hypothetical protein